MTDESDYWEEHRARKLHLAYDQGVATVVLVAASRDGRTSIPAKDEYVLGAFVSGLAAYCGRDAPITYHDYRGRHNGTWKFHTDADVIVTHALAARPGIFPQPLEESLVRLLTHRVVSKSFPNDAYPTAGLYDVLDPHSGMGVRPAIMADKWELSANQVRAARDDVPGRVTLGEYRCMWDLGERVQPFLARDSERLRG